MGTPDTLGPMSAVDAYNQTDCAVLLAAEGPVLPGGEHATVDPDSEYIQRAVELGFVVLGPERTEEG